MSNKLTPKELANARFMVPLSGGEVDCYDENGEVIWTVGMAAGVQFTDQIRNLMEPRHRITLSQGMTLIKAGGQLVQRVKPQKYGKGATETGANPDFAPASASQVERLEKIVGTLLERDKRKEARLKATERLLKEKEQRDAQQIENPQVIEAEETHQGEAVQVPEGAETVKEPAE